MKLQKIVSIIRHAEVYPTRAVLYVPMAAETAAAAPLRDLEFLCKGVQYRNGALELLIKVFPEGMWEKAKAVRALLRWLRHRGERPVVRTMSHRNREPQC